MFTNDFSREIWETTYKNHDDASIEDTLKRVAKAIASCEATEELRVKWAETFYRMLQDFKVLPGGRILANAGTNWDQTTLFNCYVSPYPKSNVDSIEGIYKLLDYQANTLKSEGGYGVNFSHLRPRGAFIHGVGVDSPGSIKFAELFDKSSEIVTSGSGLDKSTATGKNKIRKGAQMLTLNCDHPDIVEFITAKQTPGRLTKFNVSVAISDDFMARLEFIRRLEQQLEEKKGSSDEEHIVNAINDLDKWPLQFPETTFEKYKLEWDGDLTTWKKKGYPVVTYKTISVRGLWDLIMSSTYNRNEPGVIFLDRANALNPARACEKIVSTNPSMPKGVLVHTNSGIFPIEALEGKNFSVKSLDGTWAKANCFLSSESEPILNFGIGKFKTLRSTKEHRWPVYDQRMDRIYKVYAKDLKVGDLIPMNRNEAIGIYGDLTLTEEEGFFLGYLIGDGWFNKRIDTGLVVGGITFGLHEQEMAEKVKSIAEYLCGSTLNLSYRENEIYFQFGNKRMSELLLNRYRVIPGVKNIPESVWTSNDNFIKGFIDGLYSSDGHVSKTTSKSLCVTLTTSRKELAVGLSKLLSFAGIQPSISESHHKDIQFPNGKSYNKTYTKYDVSCTGNNAVNFANVFSISHPEKRVRLEILKTYVYENVRGIRTKNFVEITSVHESTPEKVWDIAVDHNQHVFPSEWAYTGNCGEIPLPPGGICCLGTVNLTQFVNKEGTGFNLEQIEHTVKNLVRFLDNVNSVSNAPLPEYIWSKEHKRRIGLGVMGWGSALFMIKERFGSERASHIKEELMKSIARSAYEASIDLAEEKGMYSVCVPEDVAATPFVTRLGLSPSYMAKLRRFGIRNSALLSSQPNGNTSILANIVSGGIEPVFMPEYTRTTIMQTIPEHLKGVTPKYYEGEFKETEFFKFVMEGDDRILRGEESDGTVWKIDQNRGLTKEVHCEDYAVTYLKKKGEWNPDAEWAVTTTSISAMDHVKDLAGFCKYIDNSASKTVNLPADYPFEDFKNLYTEAYNTGYIKGITTYRAGTMMSVLSAKEEKTASIDEEEIILEDVKLPDSAPAMVKTLKVEGKKWYLTVVMNETNNRPFALFVTTNVHEPNVTTFDATERLLHLAADKGIPARHIEEILTKIKRDSNHAKMARVISLLLRHGVFIREIVRVLDTVDNVFVGSFLFQIKKFLSTFIKDGEKAEGVTCPDCGGSNIIYSEGCQTCRDCGNSKCG